MPKKAVSVTLDEANVLWLKGRARISGGNVSETLDQLITKARTGGSTHHTAATSVVGMVDLSDDPELLKAEQAVKAYWSEWLSSLPMVSEDPPAKPTRKGKGTARG